jgi:hypothetical protein
MLALLYTLTFKKTAFLEKSAFQSPVNVKEFGLCTLPELNGWRWFQAMCIVFFSVYVDLEKIDELITFRARESRSTFYNLALNKNQLRYGSSLFLVRSLVFFKFMCRNNMFEFICLILCFV